MLAASAQAQLRVYKILPSLTDEDINIITAIGDEHHVYISDSLKPLNKLFVFLPGTGGRGKNPRFVPQFAARMGYHSISLTYPSDLALAQICKSSPDQLCFDNGRDEIIFGKDLSKEWNVNEANGIENRLRKLLLYLSKAYPSEKWNQFLTKNEEINWLKVCVAGQSQGGGHAAFIAQRKKVDRVLMFGSPKDYSDYFHKPAQWLYAKSETSINRYFGFVHTLDERNGCTWPEQVEIFKIMGFDVFGKWVNVDEAKPPYSNTRTLTSIKQQPFAHGSVINDPGYEPVWRYMLTSDMK